MGNLTRFHAADLPALLDRINKNSIGMDEYFDRLFEFKNETTSYPPYNLVQLSNVESRLEIALAGFKKEEINVYTEYGKLFVDGKKDDKEEQTSYVHRGLAQRSFTRSWTLSDETEVRSVVFENGRLTISLAKVVPEHHARRDFDL